MKPLAVLIAGPTASGKSALALALAERTGGVIINADSMQVYDGLRVITARPPDADLTRAPHALYGHVDPAADYSVGRWLADMAAALADARAAGRLPIVVGGTGLYFRGLTQGLAPVPDIPDSVRTAVRTAAEGDSTVILHARLATLDPETAVRLQPRDRQRILRALEVFEATGRPLSHWQREPHSGLLDPGGCVRLVLEMDRDTLNARIDARFHVMMTEGALAEVEQLDARALSADRPLLKAQGVPALLRHLHGELSLAQAVAEGQSESRRYAKRQVTWFRHQMDGWLRASPQQAPDVIEDALRP